MFLADCLSQFPSRKENMSIKLHQNIHNIYFTPDKLKHRGVVERKPIHSTIYMLTLNGWSKRIQEVPSIACHFWGTRDELTIENGVLLKETECLYPLSCMRRCSVISTATTEDERRWDTCPRPPSTGLEEMQTLLIILTYARSVPSIRPSKQSSLCTPEMYQILCAKTWQLTSSPTTTKRPPCCRHFQ